MVTKKLPGAHGSPQSPERKPTAVLKGLPEAADRLIPGHGWSQEGQRIELG